MHSIPRAPGNAPDVFTHPLLSALTRPPDQAAHPQIPAPAMNPYTHQALAGNEYVGVAGSEATHPGMVRIPPPGWDNPANPNYERRNYDVDAKGNIIAHEAGFQAGNDHPWDTGRPGERNSENANRGYTHVGMSEPGVIPWGPGQKNPNTPHAFGNLGQDAHMNMGAGPGVVQALLGGRTQAASVLGRQAGPQSLPAELMDFLAALRERVPQHPALPAIRHRRRRHMQAA
jgi:hypothetical protein